MRILFSSSFIYKSQNGAAIFAQLFLRWAEKRNHEVDVLSIEDHPSFLSIEKPRYGPLFPLKLSSTIARKIQTLDPTSYDVLYFNNIIEASSSIRRIKHPHIMGFLHDSQYMNDVFPNVTWKRKAFRSILKRIEKRTINGLSKVHTNSQQMKDQIHRVYKKPLSTIDYCYFSSLDAGPLVRVQKEVFTILFIKSNYVSGGLFTLLNACTKLTFPHKIIVVGPPSSHHSKIKADYPTLQLDLHDYAHRDEINLLFARTDVFITPAFTEPMGIGNFEAMQRDIPVIGNDVEGVKEIAQHSNAILLFEKNNSEDLALKIALLKNDQKLSRTLIQNGRNFIMEHINEKIIFQHFDRMISF